MREIPEECVCAAIKLADGEILQGNRHFDCFGILVDRGFHLRERTGEVQGFMTNKGRFVDRKEALQLQLSAGRASARGEYVHNQLYSEDLY